ncbi:hypothetical protein PGT21_050084 [Puccinia graminis f. sp. tritici]|uniref:Uncharacterized protein n=1 Tax=Puccinia graminis f. sp. tritici TaxID=56615 RepID=A0A5B0MRH4_PUCGR|nr:hypothetical protein PGT21_050084 [Puccinia graminis f. sp. tritici]
MATSDDTTDFEEIDHLFDQESYTPTLPDLSGREFSHWAHLNKKPTETHRFTPGFPSSIERSVQRGSKRKICDAINYQYNVVADACKDNHWTTHVQQVPQLSSTSNLLISQPDTLSPVTAWTIRSEQLEPTSGNPFFAQSQEISSQETQKNEISMNSCTHPRQPPRKCFEKFPWLKISESENISQQCKASLEAISQIQAKDLGGACAILKRNHQFSWAINSKDYTFVYKIHSFIQDREVWYSYWHSRTKIDLSLYHKDDMIYVNFPGIFPVFLFYVEMIITLIPGPNQSQENEKMNYTKELEKACKFFQKLKNAVIESYKCGKGTTWNQKKLLFLKNFGYQKKKSFVSLWNVLELWLESNQEILWQSLSEGDGKCIGKNAKSILNNIFFHESENLTKYLKYAMDEPSLFHSDIFQL